MPVIGVPVRYDYSKDEGKTILYIYESVRRSLQAAGAEVFLILPIQDIDQLETKNSDFPPFTDEEKIKINRILDRCDGLFLPGGIKFTPFDRYILDYTIKNDVPTLGVCLSMQMMSCYEEDIDLEKIESDINHQQPHEDYVHDVNINEYSKLYKILGKNNLTVNSSHSYKATPNHVYEVVAMSPDGIIEGLEHPTCAFNIGVQWHPEKTYSINEDSKRIIDTFIEEADKYRKKRLYDPEII